MTPVAPESGRATAKVAWIDLTTAHIGETSVDLATGEEVVAGEGVAVGRGVAGGGTTPFFPGGAGLALSVFLRCTHNGSALPDPLGPANPLVFAAGPLAGTPIPATSRMVICARSPQTGLWGESNLGGFAPADLRQAGYLGLVVTGRAEQPSLVEVRPEGVSVRACPELWGLDTYETYDRFTGKGSGEAGVGAGGNRPPSVLAIGPAGENLVPFAAVVHNRRHVAGRTGMGAVMGSKNLKAVVVWSGGGRAATVDHGALLVLRRRLLPRIEDHIPLQAIRSFGTSVNFDAAIYLGTIPVQNWRRGAWDEGLERLGAGAYQARLGDGRATCFGCPVSCKREVRVAEGPFALSGPGPEFETVAALGSLLMIDDVAAVAKANDLCNRLGLDTISTGGVVAAAIEAVERGLLGSGARRGPVGDGAAGCEDFGWSRLTWGDPGPVLELIHRIARRRGTAGRMLGGGVRHLVEQLGPGAEDLAIHVKGLAVPMHDPRASHGQALAYAISTRGACHRSHLNQNLESGLSFYPEVGLEGPVDEKSSVGKGAMTVKSEDLSMILGSSAIVCLLGGFAYSVTDLVDSLTAATGRRWTADDVMAEGRRIWLAKRALNYLMGARKADDRLPRRFTEALKEGPAAGYRPDMATMLEEYYRLRELDESGRPSPNALAMTGLPDLARELAEVSRVPAVSQT